MSHLLSTLSIVALVGVAGCASPPPPEAVLSRADCAMCGTALKTLAFSARGSGGTFGQACEPAMARPGLHDLWTTPRGVLKAAQRHGARSGTQTDGGRSFATLAVTVPGVLEATAWIDEAGLVARIDSKMPHPVMSDTAVTTLFSDHRDHGGVKFPGRFRQSMAASRCSTCRSPT